MNEQSSDSIHLLLLIRAQDQHIITVVIQLELKFCRDYWPFGDSDILLAQSSLPLSISSENDLAGSTKICFEHTSTIYFRNLDVIRDALPPHPHSDTTRECDD